MGKVKRAGWSDLKEAVRNRNQDHTSAAVKFTETHGCVDYSDIDHFVKEILKERFMKFHFY